jgi:hypothetical protein
MDEARPMTQAYPEVLVASQSPNMTSPEAAPPVSGQPARPALGSRLSWLRTLPTLARPITRTMPWGTLLTGCLAGTVYLAAMAHAAGTSRWPLGQGAVRLALLPALAALAFVPRAPFRPLTQTTPVPAWVAPAGHLLLAVPILAATCWAQLRIMVHTVPPRTAGHPPAVYPLIAQLTGWCAITVGVAVCVDRSRYADLGGAIAAPVSLAAIALAWYAPRINRILLTPPATAHAAAIAWYAITATALAVTGAALRDRWHRCTRRPGLQRRRALARRSGGRASFT